MATTTKLHRFRLATTTLLDRSSAQLSISTSRQILRYLSLSSEPPPKGTNSNAAFRSEEKEEEEEKGKGKENEKEKEDADTGVYVNQATGEVGGPRGPEPTRYGDWEKKGRCSDF